MIDYRMYESSQISNMVDLVILAFTTAEGEAEGIAVGNLVRELATTTDSRDLFGFVAFEDSALVGAVFFSRLRLEKDVEIFILSPLAIHPEHQGKYLGQGLVQRGLAELEREGVEIVVTYGDPSFYEKVGFHPLSEEVLKAPFRLSQPEGWLGQSFKSGIIETALGPCSCVPALNKAEYW